MSDFQDFTLSYILDQIVIKQAGFCFMLYPSQIFKSRIVICIVSLLGWSYEYGNYTALH